MLEQTFQTLIRATEELSWTTEREALERMRDVYQEKLYFVAFIGRFSAGKSCLLNNLLGREILPRGVSETTPLLTYIRYGERERARLHYLNGDVQVLELDQASNIIQHSRDWNLEELDYLEIFLQSGLLSGGMVLLDTPGVGTLIERHEQLLASSLSLAARVVYVSGGAPSKSDIEHIDAMHDQGFDILYVRTHCDQIQAQEESASQVVAADLKVLQAHNISNGQCFHLSNESQSPWHASLEPLRQNLKSLGADTGAALERDMEAQLSALAKRCYEALADKQSLLRETAQGNAQALEARCRAVKQKVQALADGMERRRSQLKHQTAQCRRMLEGNVWHKLKLEVENSAQRIENSGEEISSEEDMKFFLRREAGAVAQKAYEMVNDMLDPVMQEINGDIQLDSLHIGQEGLPKAENYAQVMQSQDIESQRLRQQLNSLRSREEEIAQTLQDQLDGPAYRQIVQELQEMELALAEIQTENKELGPYTPQLIAVDDGKMQPSQIARVIGDMADWALLLLPGEAVASGIVSLGKNEKVFKRLSKWLAESENVSKVFKQAKKADNIKDSLYALGQIGQKVSNARVSKRRKEMTEKLIAKTASQAQRMHNAKQNLQEKNVPFLELLTVGYWAERAASHFDRPPRMVVDQEKEAEYRRVKREIEDRERSIQQKQYQLKCGQNLFRSEQERQEAQLKSLQVDRQKVQAELERRKREIEENARRQCLKQWKIQCASRYREQMLEQLKQTLQTYLEEMPERLEAYQDQRLSGIAERLRKEQEAYDAMASAPDAVAEELERVSALLERVGGYTV